MARPPSPGRVEANPPPASGYPSAYDIPKFTDMREQLAAMKLLTAFTPSMRETYES